MAPGLACWHRAASELPPHLLTSCSFTLVSKRCLSFPEESMSIPVFHARPCICWSEITPGEDRRVSWHDGGDQGRESSLLVFAPFRLKSPRIKPSAEFCPEWRPSLGRGAQRSRFYWPLPRKICLWTRRNLALCSG